MAFGGRGRRFALALAWTGCSDPPDVTFGEPPDPGGLTPAPTTATTAPTTPAACATPEIPYDGVDNDCDGATPDDDLDGDGFLLADDCDDQDAAVAFTGSWWGDVGREDVAHVCAGFCTRDILGSLVLDGDLSDLAALGCVTSVGGDLYVAGNPALTAMSGLSQLTAVGGNLTVVYNPALEDLDLPALAGVGGDVLISDNDAMVGLSGFAGLTEMPGSLLIWNNDGLVDLAGLAQVSAVGGSLSLMENAALPSLGGLDQLVAVAGDLSVSGNALTDLAGLGALTSVGGSLSILFEDGLVSLAGADALASAETVLLQQLPVLSDLGTLGQVQVNRDLWVLGTGVTDLAGLTGTASVGGALVVWANPALVDLHGLEDLRELGTSSGVLGADLGLVLLSNATLNDVTALYGLESIDGGVRIEDNPALTDAAAWALVDAIGQVSGGVTVDANDPVRSAGRAGGGKAGW